MTHQKIIDNCRILLQAHKEGTLGYMKMPEDEHPNFQNIETRLVYFTLPMSLNYQRNSYTLRESTLKTYNDKETKGIFDISLSATYTENELREKLLKHKIALQPNKHIATRSKIAKTIHKNRGSISGLLEASNYDFLILQEICQKKYKKGFPYLSGPKIFHYRNYVLQQYCDIHMKNDTYIEIAPDTHVLQASIRLGVVSEAESLTLTKDQISNKWRDLLKNSGITPIQIHSPLWFWSRNNFSFKM